MIGKIAYQAKDIHNLKCGLSSFARDEGIKLKEALITLRTKAGIVGILQPSIPWDLFTFIKTTYDISLDFRVYC